MTINLFTPDVFRFLINMQTVILIILALSFLFTVSFLVENIVYEKEHGLTEVWCGNCFLLHHFFKNSHLLQMMRCMGADTAVIWLSWVISTLPQVAGNTLIGSFFFHGIVWRYAHCFRQHWSVWLTRPSFSVMVPSFVWRASPLYSCCWWSMRSPSSQWLSCYHPCELQKCET